VMDRQWPFSPFRGAASAQRIVSVWPRPETIGLIHGDVRAASLMCPESADAFFDPSWAAVRVRPAEGYALADLAPEAFETLAPERIDTGSPPTIASDIYACGCLCGNCSPAVRRWPVAIV